MHVLRRFELEFRVDMGACVLIQVDIDAAFRFTVSPEHELLSNTLALLILTSPVL